MHKDIYISTVVCKKLFGADVKGGILIYVIFVSFLRYRPFLFVVLLHAKTSDLIKLYCVNNIGFYLLKMGELWGGKRDGSADGIASCSSTGRANKLLQLQTQEFSILSGFYRHLHTCTHIYAQACSHAPILTT